VRIGNQGLGIGDWGKAEMKKKSKKDLTNCEKIAILIVAINSLLLRVRGQVQLTPCCCAFGNRQINPGRLYMGLPYFFGEGNGESYCFH